MKKYIVLLVISIIASKAAAQLEVYGQFNQSGQVVPDINIYGEKKISTKINLSYFALVEQKWSEALVGIIYSPNKYISIGAMTGIEQNPALYRFYGSLWLGKDKTSLSLLFEKGHGTDNYWYKHTLSYKVSDNFIIAARAWRYNGVGPLAIYSIKKLGIAPFAMPAHDFESGKNRLIVGVDITL